MKSSRFLAALTLINFTLLVFQLTRMSTVQAKPTEGDQILRGKGLEILDDQGRMRVQFKVMPADPKVKMPNGKTMADTVIFRLISPDGKPRVKIGTSEQGSGMSLVGDSDATYAILESDLDATRLKFKQGETEKILRP